MARVTSVQRISKLLEIISKYYKTVYNLLCIIMMRAQKIHLWIYMYVCMRQMKK